MKKVLIIGAGFLQDFVIQKAVDLGYYTLAVDADPNAIGFTHADKHAVINIVDQCACLEYAISEKIDGVLTAATDYGVLSAAFIAEQMGLPGLHYETAKLIKNKFRTRKCLFDNKVDDSSQVFEINNHTNIKELSTRLIYPVIVKPCDGSGSRGTSRVDNPDCLESACNYAISGSITNRAVIESFIIGKEYGAECLVDNGITYVLAIMKKWMTKEPYYAELGHAIPCGLPRSIEEKVHRCVEKAIQALGINHGAVNMDIIITEKGDVHIIDIGARMGGNMIGPCIIPYGTGIDYVGNIIRNAVGEPLDWNVRSPKAVATRLLAFNGGVIKSVPNVQAYKDIYDVDIYHHMEIGKPALDYHTNLDGYGYIVAVDEQVQEAIRKVDKALIAIKNDCIEI